MPGPFTKSAVCVIPDRRLQTRAVILTQVLLMSIAGGLMSCNDLSRLAGKPALPAGISDPTTYNNPAGARELYNNAIDDFMSDLNSSGPFVAFVLTSGVLTDELQAGNFGATGSAISDNEFNQIDARQLPEGGTIGSDVYQSLQGFRGMASEGIGALAAYDDTAPTALRGQLYALQGFSEIFLADLFCSGVPLSTLDFNANFTYHAGSTRDQLYADARAKFDTALTLSADSTQVLNLARVGKGRAWLALGQFDSAAAAVASVPTGFVYQIGDAWNQTGFNSQKGCGLGDCFSVTVSDREGGRGLPFRSNHDPRDSVEQTGVNAFGVPQYAPFKYGGAAISRPGGTGAVIFPVTLADWVEARLITAEAALPLHNASRWGNWLTILNSLRQTVTIPGQTQPLPMLTDPGNSANDSARVSLLFQERAYWLFLTGHRQGDLRRLIRQYGRPAEQVYPTGAYPLAPVISRYGGYVNIPVPSTERINPKFTGCLSRGA